MNILACLHDLELVKDLMTSVRSYPNVSLYALSSLPLDVSTVDAMNTDVCLLDYEEDRQQVFTFAYFLNRLHHRNIPILIVLKESEYFYIKDLKTTSKTTSYISAPYTAEDILNELLLKGSEHQNQTVIMDYSTNVSCIIQELGIPLHYNGFRFIKSAAIMLYQYDGQLMSMVQLYREIARIHKTTSSRVEKAMRDAIEYAYRSAKEKITIRGRKPTNSQLVYFVYEQALNEVGRLKGDKCRRLVK